MSPIVNSKHSNVFRAIYGVVGHGQWPESAHESETYNEPGDL